jgi:glycosyltransferase involved in cell wall biosynthesis
MRVLHFFKTYWPDSFGGVERTIHALAKGASAHGIYSDVLALSHNPASTPFQFDGHTVHQVHCDLEFASTGFSRTAFGSFATLSDNADIIHYHFPWPFMDLVELFSNHGKPIVVTYHSDIVKQKLLNIVYRPLMRRFLNRADCIVATSPNYLSTSTVLQHYRDKTKIIPLGLDEADYPPATTERIAYWRNKFPGGFFLFIGVLRYYKGIHILFEAAKQSKLPVVVVGGGNIEGRLKKYINAENVTHFHLLGALPDEDKIALLSLCRALIMPSHLRSEAFGLSLVEAAMFAKPMISCEIGTGTSYVNKHRETGLVIPPNDPASLVQAMEYLWEDNLKAEQFGKAARKRYIDSFTADQMVRSYISLYQSLLPSRTEERL